MEKVQLSNADVWFATQSAAIRAYQSYSIKSQERLRSTTYEDSLKGHLLGTYGELAVAKWLNIFTSLPAGVWKNKPDLEYLGVPLEVRHRSDPRYDLNIRRDDDPNSVYIMTSGTAPEITIHGGILGKEGMLAEYIQTYGNMSEAYFVPKDKLYDTSRIISLIGLISKSKVKTIYL